MKRCNVLTFLLVALLYSCAQQLTPTGGKEDNNPPKLVKANPPNETVNFKDKTIYLRFDEYITLQNLNEHLLISPPFKNQPEIVPTGKGLKIKIKDTLNPNTTYRIYLGSAITDIHENNKTENFVYTFSTGQVIDTLTIAGKVVNAVNNQPAEGVNIQVYKADEDSVGLKHFPRYITKTNKEGNYTLRGLAEGEYVIIALKDANKDYIFQPSTDHIGFLDNVVRVTADTNKSIINIDDIRIFEELPDKIFVKKINNNNFGKVEIIFNNRLNNPKFKIAYPPENINSRYIEFNFTTDTLTLFYNEDFKDSAAIILDADNFKDTLKLTLKKTRDNVRNQKIKPTLNLSVAESKENMILPDKPIILQSYLPIIDSKQSTIVLITEKDTTHLEFELLQNGRVLLKNFVPKPKQEMEILILPQTFTDILGNSNDSIKFSLKTPDPQLTGSLKFVAPITLKGKLIVELLDAKSQTVAKLNLKAGQEQLVNYLSPESYSVKIIEDKNGNELWDTGNFTRKIQPERIITKTDIQIKKRFETEVKLDIYNLTN